MRCSIKEFFMCDEWMKPLQMSMTSEQFLQLPRNPAFKYEYLDGSVWISPRPRFFHGLLDLTTLETAAPARVDATLTLRGVQAGRLGGAAARFAASFQGRQPFGGLNDKEMEAAAEDCLVRTRRGGDGPWIARASYLAFRAYCAGPSAAC